MLSKCPICHKRFKDISETWREIIGCPQCGMTREDAEKLAAAPTHTPTENTPEAAERRREAEKNIAERRRQIRHNQGRLYSLSLT